MPSKTKALFRQILRAKGYRLRFVYLQDFADINDDLIRINLHRNTPPARSMIHEFLHFLHPKMSHREVNKWEKEIWNSLSQNDKLKLYRKLFR
mgnify:CR=1 FL=1